MDERQLSYLDPFFFTFLLHICRFQARLSILLQSRQNCKRMNYRSVYIPAGRVVREKRKKINNEIQQMKLLNTSEASCSDASVTFSRSKHTPCLPRLIPVENLPHSEPRKRSLDFSERERESGDWHDTVC